MDLGEVAVLRAGERREERVIEGDLAEHDVATGGGFLDGSERVHPQERREGLGPARRGGHVQQRAAPLARSP